MAPGSRGNAVATPSPSYRHCHVRGEAVGGHGCKVGRGEGEVFGCVHTHTGTRAYVLTHTQEATIAHFPHRQALPLSFHSLHWMTSQPCPRPGAARSPPSRRCSPSNQTLLQCSGPAQYCPCGLQDFRSSSGPTPCPLPLLSLSCLCFATLASLPSCAPAFAHAVPSAWKTFLSHPSGRPHVSRLTQLSCHFLRASSVSISALSQGLCSPPPYPMPSLHSMDFHHHTGLCFSGSDSLCLIHLSPDWV